MQDQSAKMAKASVGRASTSCSECQRRKQKCDKQWPCRHCQDRRVPHLCQFKKKSQTDRNEQAETAAPSLTSGIMRPVSPPRTVQKRKVSEVEAPDEQAVMYVNRYFHLEKDLEGLGYIGPGRNQKLRDVLGDAFAMTTKAMGVEAEKERGKTDPFPPRPYADVLIHNFLDNINFIYCICHPESLLQEYDTWWSTRRSQPNIELECLLFRLMAISAQFLPEAICERLEDEMSEDIVSLKHRWHDSAESLHREIRPGKGGLKLVQNLMLTAAYFKTEAMFIDSWHTLSTAIRTAQEINMHRDSQNCDISDFEREVRRTVWLSLYNWDRLMAFLFDRPPLIHRGRCILVEPKLELHMDPIRPDLPSPLLGKIQEFRLTQVLDKYLDQDLSEMTVRELVMPLKDIKEWLASLPPVFMIKNPDTTWDQQHPRIKYSRLSLHTTAYSALFHVLQPCLTNENFPEGSSINERERLRSACMDYAVRMTDIVDHLTRYPTHSRYHMAFCLFETSATVCAAIIKDKERKLPRRRAVLQAIGRGCNILDRLGNTTAVAKSSAKILNELMFRLQIEQPDTGDIISEGRSIAIEMDIDHSAPVVDIDTSRDSGIGYSSTEENSPSSDDAKNGDGSSITPDTTDLFPVLDDNYLSVLDLAALEQMWDWGDLNLDMMGFDAGNGLDFNGHMAPPGPEVH